METKEQAVQYTRQAFYYYYCCCYYYYNYYFDSSGSARSFKHNKTNFIMRYFTVDVKNFMGNRLSQCIAAVKSDFLWKSKIMCQQVETMLWRHNCSRLVLIFYFKKRNVHGTTTTNNLQILFPLNIWLARCWISMERWSDWEVCSFIVQ